MTPRLNRCLCFCICFVAFAAGFAKADNAFAVSSPDFAPGRPIPPKFGYHQQNISPALRIENIPTNAKSLVLIMDDPDSPSGLWTHWLVWNLPANTTAIAQGKLPPDAREGKNSFGHFRYDGPAPPSGTHRYFFRLYALDQPFFPKFRTSSERADILTGMEGHVVGKAETFGIYSASP